MSYLRNTKLQTFDSTFVGQRNPNNTFEEKRTLQCKQKTSCRELLQFFIDFFSYTSIHGFVYLTKFGHHVIERILWWLVILLAIYGSIFVSSRTWNRFQTSPVVISMDRNMMVWNTSFPSITICPRTKVDAAKLDKYFRSTRWIYKSAKDRSDFTKFINFLSALTYENVNSTLFPQKTFNIPSTDYMSVIQNFSFFFHPEINGGTGSKILLQETITELGICYAVNSKIAFYNSLQYWKTNHFEIQKYNETFYIHPLEGEVFVQMTNLSTSYDLWVHGENEIPEITKQRYSFKGSDYTTIELQALEIKTSKNVADLKITQRKCRFPHENKNMLSSPIYSYNQCLIDCRKRMAIKECGCIPHFYRPITIEKGSIRSMPVCDLNGWKCLEKIKDEMLEIISKPEKCYCDINCDDSHFFVKGFRSREWFLGAALQWGIIEYPKMQLNREVLFSISDVLVYIGGTAGLFLGSSLLGIMEIFYYFIVKLMKICFQLKRPAIN